MYFRRFIFLALPVVLMASCSDDPAAPEGDFAALNLKENVLSNLELAYEKQAVDEIAKLLDASYTFCWQPSPTSGSECFNRTDALFINTRFFESGWYYIDDNSVDRILVELTSAGGEPGWIRSTTDRYPVVKIYEQAVDYVVSVRQDGAAREIGSGRTTVFLAEKDGLFKLRGIFDHDGLWGSLHKAYESGP